MDFSIITCTYNPNKEIFLRLTKAIENLEIPGNSKIEWLIIDNNSNPPLEQTDFIRSFVNNKSYVRIINESQQGLTSARIRGINEAKYDWVIFFDDDNEPDKKYLIGLQETISLHADVVCWGPGIIQVEYIGNVKSKWVRNKKEEFQDRYFDEIQICTEPGCKFLPPGTGLAMKKDPLIGYKESVRLGKYNMTDRKGNSLISGGDTQIVLDVLKKGFFTGISPALKINHLICESKANKKYLLRLKYWTASSYVKVFNEVFTEKQIGLSYLPNLEIIKRIISIIRVKRKESINNILFTISDRLGEINARYIAGERKSPLILKIWERLIQ